MQDQVQYLNGLGLKAIALTEDLEDYIIEPVINDEYSYAYWSPESLLNKDALKNLHKITMLSHNTTRASPWQTFPLSRFFFFFSFFFSFGGRVGLHVDWMPVQRRASPRIKFDGANLHT